METRLALKTAGLLGLSVVGIPGNLTALLLFCHLFIVQEHIPPNEFILSQLVLANLIVALFRVFPQALTAVGINLQYTSQVCKFVNLGYRVGRAMSITVTSLLSSYQCVVMAPSTPGWTWLKRWLPGHLPHIIIFLYVLSIIIYPAAILYIEATPANRTMAKFAMNFDYCIMVFPSPIVYLVNGAVYIIRDFTFVGLMVAAAGYVMLLLHRHRQQVKDLQGAGRKTEEASRAVLLLVSMYVVLFGLDNVLWFYTLSVSHVHPAVSDARHFFTFCYSALSPVLIIATNKKLAMYFRCGSKHKSAEKIQSVTE